jgi:hypothetical protein
MLLKERIMNRNFLFSMIMFVFFGSSYGTLFHPNLLYYQTHMGGRAMGIGCMVSLGDNGFLLSGKDATNEYYVKIDTFGKKLWVYSPQGLQYGAYATAALATRQGNYLFAGIGRVQIDSASKRDIVHVTELNIAGTLEWEKTYDDGLNCVPECLSETDDNGFIIMGKETDKNGLNSDCFFIKIDASGALQWEKKLGVNSQNEEICALEKTSDNNLLLLAYKGGDNRTWLIKMNQAGDTLWTRTFYYQASNRLSSIKRTGDNNFICAGTSSAINGKADFWIVKIDNLGNAIWSKNYRRGGNDIAKSIDTVPGGGYCFAGESDGHSILMRISDQGDSLWTIDYGYGLPHMPVALSVSGDGRYTLTGNCGREVRSYYGFFMVFENENKSRDYTEFGNWEIVDTNNSGFASNFISNIAVDSLNRPWLEVRGQNTTCSNIMYRDGSAWKRFDSIPFQQIMDMKVSPSGHLWFAGDNGIYHYDGNKVTHVDIKAQAYAVAPIDDSSAYVGNGNGLYKLTNATLSPMTDAMAFLTSKEVDDIAIDPTSAIWYLPFYGVAVKNSASVTHYTSQNTPLPEFRAGSIQIDNKGAVWLATEIGLIRNVNNEWTVFDSTNTSLPASGIAAFVVDSAGMPYAACSRGFTHLFAKTTTLYDYNNSPLPSNGILCMAMDKQQNLWIGTDQGLVRIRSSLSQSVRQNATKRHVSKSASKSLVFNRSRAENPFIYRNGAFGYYNFLGREMGKKDIQPAKVKSASNLLIRKEIK